MTDLVNLSVPVPVSAHHDLLRIAAGRTAEIGKPTSLATLCREALKGHFGVSMPDVAPQGRQRKAASPVTRVRTRPASPPVAA